MILRAERYGASGTYRDEYYRLDMEVEAVKCLPMNVIARIDGEWRSIAVRFGWFIKWWEVRVGPQSEWFLTREIEVCHDDRDGRE